MSLLARAQNQSCREHGQQREPEPDKDSFEMPRANKALSVGTKARRNVAIYSVVHPAVHIAVVCCVIWMVLAVWYWFSNGNDVRLSLAVVTGFSVAFVATPVLLWRASPSREDSRAVPLSEWIRGEFETGSGRIHAWGAAVMVLLLPVASAAGLTALSIVANLAASGAL